MPYNSETETFYQAPATVVDSTPDGDTVQEGFDDRLTPALAGVYADFNLLKADGMISVGIPATTTARGIGRVATSADLVDGAEITNGPAFLAAGVHTSVAVAAGKIPVADADGSLNNWVGARYATCATDAATADKVADLENFILASGASVYVVFSNPNTVAGALALNVNNTGAKTVYNDNGATSASNIATWRTGVPVEFVYDGTVWRYKNVDATGNAISKYLHVIDQKSPGVNGGATSAAAWVTRDLNTVVTNNIGATLASNRITLQAGRYYIEASAPAFETDYSRAAIYDYTHSTWLLYGTSEIAGSGDSTSARSLVLGGITLTGQTQLELRMWAKGASARGLGAATIVANGVSEIFSEVRIWQL